MLPFLRPAWSRFSFVSLLTVAVASNPDDLVAAKAASFDKMSKKIGFLSNLNPKQCFRHKTSVRQSILVNDLENGYPGTHLGKIAQSFESIQRLSLRNDDVVDIDAAELLHACRTFLDVLRTTGPRAVANDFESNLGKVEASLSTAPQDMRRTVSSLLEAEIEAGLHASGSSGNVVKLRDPSGAVGLLWMRRSIAFQADMYESLVEAHHGSSSTEPSEAALGAYKMQLSDYHGWALRKFYLAFLSSKMPSRKIMLSKLGGFSLETFGDAEEEATVEDMKRLLLVWKPLVMQWKQAFVKLGLEENRRV